MFITIKAFRALIKGAYQGAGLTVGKRGDRLLFCGGYWGIELDRKVLPKKALAAVIELTGEMPKDGELFKITKEGGIQYEIPETYWMITQQATKAEVKYNVTNVLIEANGKMYRVLQTKGNETELIKESFIEAIDPSEMEFAHETNLEGPVADSGGRKNVYWKSEACTLTAFMMQKEDMEEYNFLKYLKGFILKA
ncbi:MAG: hypothetical protein RR237_05455 [Acetivibrio sp.]